ncbi:thiamineS protein [Staphylothermus marinus F1]|uniref:ThiamineS protein n=1 Tax=Staphylothermus marinus (strain ATCC 43588 / DSM 3639 / JCM 9404 / F1) TaxID=399550 RepID=A3DMM8_STAMF|nr:MoaD/ThiS family protein [Staphylothermus marinus]ABN69888.1 thiamineS protein [Staphylothermus marinus F1]
MIKITVLPDRKTFIVDKKNIKAKDLLDLLDIDDPDSVALVINDRLIDLDKEGENMIREGDKVLIIRQATGG